LGSAWATETIFRPAAIPVRRSSRVASPATSEPAPGSLNIWHQMYSPEKIRGRSSFFISSLP
jgi:hypothetical protein